ncbi:MAG: hypothetical protein KIPDCIKN_00076 [Haliscomenobacter sp.]|jgi:AAA15 family ATPase/GTPase|nr:hypothetical protein [Haliscomenobacter sp.]
MFLEFSVGNFLSFKEPVTLSLEASSITEYPENAIRTDRYTLLKSVVVYGANASGKSNLLRALAQMRQLVRASSKMSSTETLDVIPFLLHTETVSKPSFFEVLFLLDGMRYRYGFEASRERIHAEWLFEAKAKVEKPLFVRDGDDIEVAKKFAEGKGLEPKTRPNGLFLAVCDQFNGEVANKLMRWFDSWNALNEFEFLTTPSAAEEFLNNPEFKLAFIQFIGSLDLGIEDVEVVEEELIKTIDVGELVGAMEKELAGYDKVDTSIHRFKTVHNQLDSSGRAVKTIKFDLRYQESSGTRKLFELLGPVMDSLMKGRLLIIDEFDARLHPILTNALISLFNSEENNPHHAQLLCATHDTNLLTYGRFRRDQIYFTEKDRQGATALYSLVEYKEEGETVRKDRSYEKDYIQGRYGAIPYLGDFSQLFQKEASLERPNGLPVAR